MPDPDRTSVIVDSERRALRCGAQIAPLSRLQWRAVIVLEARRGQLVEREELHRAAYGDEPASEEMLTALARRIRRKLEKIGIHDSLTTVPGHGYIFEL